MAGTAQEDVKDATTAKSAENTGIPVLENHIPRESMRMNLMKVFSN